MKRPIIAVLILLILQIGCDKKNDATTAQRVSQPASQQAAQSPPPESRIQFVNNWSIGEGTKSWAAQGIVAAHGGKNVELLILFFNDKNANIAAQLMSPRSSSPEFAKMVTTAGFEKVMGVRLRPDEQPSSSFPENRIAYIGTVENGAIAWADVSRNQGVPSSNADGRMVASSESSYFSFKGIHAGMSLDEVKIATASYRGIKIGSVPERYRTDMTCTVNYGGPQQDIPATECQLWVEGDAVKLFFFENRLFYSRFNCERDSCAKAVTLLNAHFDKRAKDGRWRSKEESALIERDQLEILTYRFAPSFVERQ